jgi:hypothetical protein
VRKSHGLYAGIVLTIEAEQSHPPLDDNIREVAGEAGREAAAAIEGVDAVVRMDVDSGVGGHERVVLGCVKCDAKESTRGVLCDATSTPASGS